jgi:hypothetical protein
MPFQRPFPEDTPEFSEPARQPESPFLDEEVFAEMEEGMVEGRTQSPAGYRLDSPFQHVFDRERETVPMTRELIRQVGARVSEDGDTPHMVETDERFEYAAIELGEAEESPPDREEGALAAARRSPFRIADEVEEIAETAEDYADEEAPLSEPLESPHEQYDVSPTVSKRITAALSRKDWARALDLAIQEGWRDENQLTNLLFFERHPELGGRKLDPAKNKEDRKLSLEWRRILNREVWPAIVRSAANSALATSGKDVTSHLRQFRGKAGKEFKARIEWAAKEVGLNPGLLAANLLAETGTRRDYLTRSKVSSYRIGVDDFYDRRSALSRNVPAYSKVGWDRTQKPEVHLNDARTHPREVKTIRFNSGRDALLASAVYLKYGEVYLRDQAKKLGGDFDSLLVKTRFALVRMTFAAGPAGARKRLERALKGQDILVRVDKPLKKYQTDRNATIRAAQALHLSDWVFGVALMAGVQPELEEFEDAEDRYERSHYFNSELEEYEEDEESEDADRHALETMVDDQYWVNELMAEEEGGVRVGEDDENEVIETRELDPVLVEIAEKTIAREMPLFQHQVSTRWTTCFSAEDIARVQQVYEDNTAAASSNVDDRCSCIVMLNVALGQLLSLPLKWHPARSKRNGRPVQARLVQMGDLTTDTIEKAMEQLRRKGFTGAPTLMNFFDRRNRTAGTLKPERLKARVRDKVLASSKTEGCRFAFGMSIMDGYHSVLLLVDRTAADAKIYWLDQYSGGPDDPRSNVTDSLDQRLTDYKQRVWQAIMDEKRKGYKTTIRLWRLRKPRKTR